MAIRKSSTKRKKPPAPAAMTSEDFARTAARIADDNKAENIVVLDLRGLTSIADFFVIATGSSERQLNAIADIIQTKARELGQKPYGVSGQENGTWVLVDFVDVVIHLFDTVHRAYYDLELLWGDAPRIEWAKPAKK